MCSQSQEGPWEKVWPGVDEGEIITAIQNDTDMCAYINWVSGILVMNKDYKLYSK